MTSTNSQNERSARVTRTLTMHPADADKVRGGWFGVWWVPTTTTSKTTTSIDGVKGESTDSPHKG